MRWAAGLKAGFDELANRLLALKAHVRPRAAQVRGTRGEWEFWLEPFLRACGVMTRNRPERALGRYVGTRRSRLMMDGSATSEADVDLGSGCRSRCGRVLHGSGARVGQVSIALSRLSMRVCVFCVRRGRSSPRQRRQMAFAAQGWWLWGVCFGAAASGVLRLASGVVATARMNGGLSLSCSLALPCLCLALSCSNHFSCITHVEWEELLTR